MRLNVNEDATTVDPVIKLKRGHSRIGRTVINKFPSAFDSLEFREGPRIKTIKRHQLSSDEIMEVVDAVKVEKLAHRDVAVKYGINTGLVQRLVSEDRKDPSFRQKTREREMKRREKLRAVLNLSLRKLSDSQTLFKAADIQAEVLEQHGIKVSKTYVCGVLRHDIGAKYARVKKIPFLGNSTRCLLLR